MVLYVSRDDDGVSRNFPKRVSVEHFQHELARAISLTIWVENCCLAKKPSFEFVPFKRQ